MFPAEFGLTWLRFVKSIWENQKNAISQTRKCFQRVPIALRRRTQSLFHGNPAALEFTSCSDMEPSEVFISSPNGVSRSWDGIEDLAGVGRRNLPDLGRQEVEALCVGQACLLSGPNPTKHRNRGFLTARVLKPHMETVYRKTHWKREFWDQSPQRYYKIPNFIAHSLGPDFDHFKHFKLAL